MKYISLFGIISLIIGAFHKYIYYKAFNINIFEYVTLSESLILFDEFFPFLVLIVIITSLVPMFVDIKATLIGDQSETNKVDFVPLIDREGFWSRLKEHCRMEIKALILFIVFIPVVLLVVFIDKKNEEPKDVILISFLFIILYIFLKYISNELIDRFTRVVRKRLPVHIELLPHFIVLTIAFFICYCVFSISSIYWKSNIRITFYIGNNKTIKTDSHLKFIGQTEKYIFLHRIDSAQTYVYNRSDVNNTVTR